MLHMQTASFERVSSAEHEVPPCRSVELVSKLNGNPTPLDGSCQRGISMMPSGLLLICAPLCSAQAYGVRKKSLPTSPSTCRLSAHARLGDVPPSPFGLSLG